MSNLLFGTQEGEDLFFISNSAIMIESNLVVLGSSFVNEMDKEKEQIDGGGSSQSMGKALSSRYL